MIAGKLKLCMEVPCEVTSNPIDFHGQRFKCKVTQESFSAPRSVGFSGRSFGQRRSPITNLPSGEGVNEIPTGGRVDIPQFSRRGSSFGPSFTFSGGGEAVQIGSQPRNVPPIVGGENAVQFGGPPRNVPILVDGENAVQFWGPPRNVPILVGGENAVQFRSPPRDVPFLVGGEDAVQIGGPPFNVPTIVGGENALQVESPPLGEPAVVGGENAMQIGGPPQVFPVIGGENALPGRNNVDRTRYVPWQAGIRRVVPGRSETIHHCGGTIISQNWILTAAHCFLISSRESDFRVRVGDLDNNILEPDEREFDVWRILRHPSFQAGQFGNFDYDIALVLIRPNNGRPIQYNDNVQRAYLPSRQLQIVPRSECYSSGWGRTTSDLMGSSSNILQVARTDVLNQAGQTTCNDRYRGLITNRMICAGYLDGTVIDTCAGDSGGPLVCKVSGYDVLVGITSWGTRLCAVRGYPGVYTNVQNLLDWIYNPSA